MPEQMEHESTHLRLSEMNEALESGMFVHVKRMLYPPPPCDIALLLESSPPARGKVLWR